MSGEGARLVLALALGVVLAVALSFGFVAIVWHVHQAGLPLGDDSRMVSAVSLVANGALLTALLAVERRAGGGSGKRER